MTDKALQTDPVQVPVGERHGLSLPIELESGAPPHLVRLAMTIVTSLIIALLVWANIAQVREVAVAQGEIAPFESTRRIAHLEGGIVDQVLVTAGDAVEQGAPLIRLRPESDSGDYEQLRARRASLKLAIERLTAEAEGRTPDFSSNTEDWPALVSEQRDLFEAETAQHHAAMQSLMEQKEAARSDVQGATTELISAKDIEAVAEEQLAIQTSLIDEGFTSRQALLDARASLATARSRRAETAARKEKAERMLESIIAQELDAKAAYLSAVLRQRADAVSELAELDKPLRTMKDRSDRLVVRAPIAGIVNSVEVDGAGAVVRPGGVVAEITPASSSLIVTARIDPKDIGHIRLDQITEVAITTFDPNRYGKLKGRVYHISADRFLDERTGAPYYMADIAITDAQAKSDRLASHLRPGMQARAEIITDRRSMMEYLLKPVTRGFKNSFTER